MKSLDNIRVVLVETAHPGNIGSVARAMKTMGIHDLVLVNPGLFPCEQATWMASGAKDVLINTTVVDTLEEAIADCHLVLGTSARNRKIPWPVVEAREGGEVAERAAEAGNRVAIVFGRESKGLTNQELQLCNTHLSIPSSDEYGVLNIAMAVQVVCYEIRMHALSALKPVDEQTSERRELRMVMDLSSRWDEPLATAQEVQYFNKHLEEALVDIGFLHPHHPKQILTRLQRLFARARLDKSELSLLRGILSTVQNPQKRALQRELLEAEGKSSQLISDES